MRRAVALATLCLALSAGVAAADSREAYKLGVAAVEATRFDDAARFFRAAIAERPREKVNRLLKTAYVPHYFLGVALAESGDCRMALESFAESERQGQVQRSKHAGDLTDRRERCRNHLRQVRDAAAEVEGLLDQVAERRDALATLSRTPELAAIWESGEPSFDARQRAAEDKLRSARELLGEGRDQADLDLLDGAKNGAGEAMNAVEACVVGARERLGELNAATADALEKVQDAEQSARRVLRSISSLAPYPRRLGASVAAVDQVLASIVESKAGAGANKLSALTDELTVAVAALRRAARRPPEKLARAAEAFFGGEPQTSLDLLVEADFSRDRRARSHACLLRAASRHALWVLGGEQDEDLIELAGLDLSACERTEPPVPTVSFFSPRFVEFHRATLAAELIEGEAEGDAEPGAAAEENTAGDEGTR
ncbi:MAG: hypothetical protein GY719_17150 [bacterium]|nr:hypothetical protein [bacterium]